MTSQDQQAADKTTTQEMSDILARFDNLERQISELPTLEAVRRIVQEALAQEGKLRDSAIEKAIASEVNHRTLAITSLSNDVTHTLQLLFTNITHRINDLEASLLRNTNRSEQDKRLQAVETKLLEFGSTLHDFSGRLFGYPDRPDDKSIFKLIEDMHKDINQRADEQNKEILKRISSLEKAAETRKQVEATIYSLARKALSSRWVLLGASAGGATGIAALVIDWLNKLGVL